MKKQTGVILSLVLTGVSVFALATEQGGAARVGAGNGTNQQVATLKDMYGVLEACASTAEEREIKSLTYVENGEMSLSSGTQKVTINKTMTVYFTEEASYYISKGIVVRVNEDTKTVSYFDMHVYVKKDTTFIKFNDYSSTTKEEGDKGEEDEADYRVINPSKKGIWIECSNDISGIFSLINQANIDGFSTLKQYLKEAAEEEEESQLSKEDDIYTLEKKSEGYKMSLLYDLSKKETPYMQIATNSKENIGNSTVSTSVYSQVEFHNIGNTVIKGDIKAEYVCEDFEEFNELFNTKE